MSVLIPGMEMPTSCWECHFGHEETGVCVVDFKIHGDWNEPQDCPLAPVPTHGRLIDADALRAEVKKHATPPDAWVFSLIRTAPTIIPAEEGDE